MKRRDFLISMGAAGAALGLPLSFSSCGSAGSGGSGNKVTINWWHIQTTDPGKSMWQNYATQYMQAHPNVKINITVIENQAFKQKLTTVMQSGTPPDLFHTWGGGVLFQYAKAGLVQDLTAALQGSWGDTFNTNALSVFGQNGKYYGAPFDMGCVTFWYNKALFAKANITKLPATWTDLLSTIQQLKSAGITPISLGEKDQWPGMYWWAYLSIRLGGKDAFEKAVNRTGSFADPPFVQAGQYLQQLVALNPFQRGYLGETYTQEYTEMGNGQAAMELMGSFALANDRSAAPNGKAPDMDIFPFPMVEGGAGNPSDVFGGGGGFAVGKNAPPETIDFLKFLLTPSHVNNFVKAGFQPVFKGTQNAQTNPQLREVQQMTTNASYFQLYYDQYFPASVDPVILDQTQGLFAHTVTPQAAAKAIDDAVASALSQ